MSELSNTQKKDWAKLIYTTEGLNGKLTAQKVGVSAKTMSAWVIKGKWDDLKASLIISKEQQLRRIYFQINEINNDIETREVGKRYANSKEADTLVKLTSAAKTLETESGLSSIIEAFMGFNNWLRLLDLKKAQEFLKLQDGYIKTKL